MEIAIKLSQFLLSLSLLIILHELGHFIPAKLFKTRVEKFYLFFDVKYSLLKKKIGETEYGIGWLPLGGYVKISGMIDESMDKEQMALPPQPWEFRSKPAWQRLIIMLGGVTVNFILAFLIYIGMAYAYGDLYISNDAVKDGIWVMNPVLEKAGLHTGDKIISIDGNKVDRFESVSEKVMMSKNIVVNRGGNVEQISLPQNLIGQIVDAEKNGMVEMRLPFVVGGFVDNSANEKSLKSGDMITNIDGKPAPYIDQVLAFAKANPGKSVPVTLLRDKKETAAMLHVNAKGKLGIKIASVTNENLEQLGFYKFDRKYYSLAESVPAGLEKGKERLISYTQQLKKIFTPSTGAYKGVGGFFAIFNIFPDQWSWQAFWSITAILSIMLGVMNLLPIPALDGGHVMFLLYEMVSGKKPSDKFMEHAQMVGFVLLIALLLFANGNDLYKAVIGK